MRILVRLTTVISVLPCIALVFPAIFYFGEVARLSPEVDTMKAGLRRAEEKKQAVESGKLKLEPGEPMPEPSKDASYFEKTFYRHEMDARKRKIENPVGYCGDQVDSAIRWLNEAEGRVRRAERERNFYAICLVAFAIVPWAVLGLALWIVFGKEVFRRERRETPSHKYQ